MRNNVIKRGHLDEYGANNDGQDGDGQESHMPQATYSGVQTMGSPREGSISADD